MNDWNIKRSVVRLQDEVNTALDIAVDENGYEELLTKNPLQLAIDLCDDDEDFEEIIPEYLVPFIVHWQQKRWLTSDE